MRRGWAIALAVTLALAVVAAVIAQVILTRRGVARTRSAILSACRSSGDTTFVMIVAAQPGPTAAAAAAATLHALFSAAACPLHVFVGLYEVYDEAADGDDAVRSVAGRYKALAAASDFPFQLTSTHVRVLRIPSTQYKGGIAAREQLLRFLYRGETNLLSVTCPAALTTHWDTKLAGALRQLELRGVRDAVLTTKPAGVPLRDGGASYFSALRGALDAGAATPTFVGVHAGGTPLHEPAATFQPPQLRAFAFRGRAQAPVPALAWSHALSFSRARAAQVKPSGAPAATLLPLPRGAAYNDDLLDWLVSAALFAERRSFWHPHFVVAFALQTAAPAASPAPDADTARFGLVQQLQRVGAADAFYRAAGVKPATGRPSARARLGLTAGATGDEIAAKVGSLSDYMSMLARVDLARV
jgi:hypothetical protein